MSVITMSFLINVTTIYGCKVSLLIFVYIFLIVCCFFQKINCSLIDFFYDFVLCDN